MVALHQALCARMVYVAMIFQSAIEKDSCNAALAVIAKTEVGLCCVKCCF